MWHGDPERPPQFQNSLSVLSVCESTGAAAVPGGPAAGAGVQVPAALRVQHLLHECPSSSSYNPFDGPNENPEAELPLTAGKYLYVYGDMDEDGFYEGLLGRGAVGAGAAPRT